MRFPSESDYLTKTGEDEELSRVPKKNKILIKPKTHAYGIKKD